MAEYNGFLRFSDEAVAAVNWDDQQHSGEAGVTDEKTGTVYPFGGGDDGLVELEYTVSESYVTITKTPAEIKTLIDAGKSFKIICNDDLASAISANEGDIYVSFEYDLHGSDLLNLDFARTSTPLFTLSSGAFKTLPFSVEEGDLLQVIL